VLVTSASPLRAYVHEQALVRFAARPHDAAAGETAMRPSAFMTNTAVNSAAHAAANTTATWTLSRLYAHARSAHAPEPAVLDSR
jgi:hypothetical protein